MFLDTLAKIYKTIGITFIVFAVILLLVPLLLQENLSVQTVSAKQSSDLITSSTLYKNTSHKTQELPKIDLTLPKGHILQINKIGVNTQILESKNPQEALRKGVLRINNFATPLTARPGLPTILAAHRFGYITWTPEYRRKNSFANLNQLSEGDTIIIIWNQRKFVYKIYKIEINSKITDYNADLILYTCIAFNSPQRLFVYAVRSN